jgi:hypothetical protein
VRRLVATLSRAGASVETHREQQLEVRGSPSRAFAAFLRAAPDHERVQVFVEPPRSDRLVVIALVAGRGTMPVLVPWSFGCLSEANGPLWGTTAAIRVEPLLDVMRDVQRLARTRRNERAPAVRGAFARAGIDARCGPRSRSRAGTEVRVAVDSLVAVTDVPHRVAVGRVQCRAPGAHASVVLRRRAGEPWWVAHGRVTLENGAELTFRGR